MLQELMYIPPGTQQEGGIYTAVYWKNKTKYNLTGTRAKSIYMR